MPGRRAESEPFITNRSSPGWKVQVRGSRKGLRYHYMAEDHRTLCLEKCKSEGWVELWVERDIDRWMDGWVDRDRWRQGTLTALAH